MKFLLSDSTLHFPKAPAPNISDTGIGDTNIQSTAHSIREDAGITTCGWSLCGPHPLCSHGWNTLEGIQE
jgi:hypothetical protein